MTTEEKKTDTLARIERAWKLIGIIIGALGLVSAGANWAFSYAMSDRDEQVAELTSAIRGLEDAVGRMRDKAEEAQERSEQDMRDVQVALRILEVKVGYERRPMASPAGPPTLTTAVPARVPEPPAAVPEPDLSAVLERIRRRHPAPSARMESSQ